MLNSGSAEQYPAKPPEVKAPIACRQCDRQKSGLTFQPEAIVGSMEIGIGVEIEILSISFFRILIDSRPFPGDSPPPE